ncbi:hypothetical protein SDC9_195107 [bioreactor metagenome]|uniref:Uncharacterized protein n=1 Tax=bioreactor metagenome TaxID=1076179 RepID=A0A645I838_9ZZZZ
MRVCRRFDGLITEVTLFPNPSREGLEKHGLGVLADPCWMLARQHLCAGNSWLMVTTSNIIIFAIALVLTLGMAGLTYTLIWALFRAVVK